MADTKTKEQEPPAMMRQSDTPNRLVFVHEVDVALWKAMGPLEKRAWVDYNLRYMVRHLDRISAEVK
jgi:hypothetical protein